MPYWEKLKNAVLMTDLIVDKLVFKDIQLTATNDDQYFVFEDILYQVGFSLVSNYQMLKSQQSNDLLNYLNYSVDYALFFSRHRD